MLNFSFFRGSSSSDDEAGRAMRGRLSVLRNEALNVLPSDHPDRVFVDRVRSGDRKALNRLVEEYFTPLARYAFQFVDSYDSAEDVAQGVLFRVWERRGTWTPRTGVRAYLFTAVRNAALDIRKHRDVADRLDPLIALERPAVVLPDEPDDVADDRRKLRAAVAQLTERQRTVLHLRYEQQLAAREVAVVLGVSTRAVERMVARALTLLRVALEHPSGDE